MKSGVVVEYSSPIKEIAVIEKIKGLYTSKNKLGQGLLFSLAINSGALLVDLLRLNVSDVRGKDYLVFGGKYSVKINDTLKSEVEEVVRGKRGDEPLFVSRRGKRLERSAVYRAFREICDELVLNRRISVASWRKTFGYHYYMKYNDLLYLQWRFGQESVESTMKYIEVEENMNLRYREGVCL